MHILYLCNEYPPFPHGGIGIFVQMMARQMVKKGHKASVVGFSPLTGFRQENDMGVEVYRFPTKGRKINTLFNQYFGLAHFIRKLNAQSPIDLLEGNEPSFGSLPGRLPGRKIIRIHGGHHFFSVLLGQPRRVFTSLIERISFARADRFCAVSRFAAEETRNLMKLGTTQIEILPNPVDTDLFCPQNEIKEQEGLIVFTGGLREKKGVRQLIQAMPKVMEKHPSARLWIHGADKKDRRTGRSFLQELKEEIDPAAASRIEFRGAIPHEELPRINALASVLVYPSWMETQGIVVIEGMASGKPVIASQTGPGPELITDGQDGLLCDPHSPDSIAEKVLLLMENPELRRCLGNRARERALKQYSVIGIVEKNLDFYSRCLSHERN